MKTLRIALTLSLVAITGAALFGGGFVAGHFAAGAGLFPQLVGPGNVRPADGGTPEELSSTFEPFWEAWSIVHKEYVEQPVDDIQLMRGAISGMLESLDDPYTAYLSPEEYAIANTHLQGEFEGIGAVVEGAGDYLRIVSPFPGSPAEAAGLLPGDLIVKVDGTDVAGLGETKIIGLVRGPAGTTVRLTVHREGHTDPLEFAVVRAKINIPSVESEMLEGKVAYVKINDFGEKTTRELRDALRALLAEQPVGLVLDLRGNPGGFLDTAIEVASQFISEGVIMRERFGDGREITYRAKSGGRATEVPLVVLINQGSASASEIVAGAIQDRQRGTLVGETSFGKGLVQAPHELSSDQGYVKVTIAHWLTPNGRSIQKLGVEPDVTVELTEEDRAAGRDPQLERAINLLTNSAAAQASWALSLPAVPAQ